MTRPCAGSFVVLFTTVGCGIVQLDAGSNHRSDGGGVPDAALEGYLWSGTPRNMSDTPCTELAPDWLAGSWRGQFDAYTLPSGSTSIRIDVHGALREGGACGTVVFGEGDPLPLPTDAAAPPPGAPLDVAQIGRELREGFAYGFSVAGPQGPDAGFIPPILGRRVRFGVNLMQVYTAWCNLQPAYHFTPDVRYQSRLFQFSFIEGYSCVPSDFVGPPGDGISCPEFSGVSIRRVSCVQAALCAAGACYCTGPSPPNLSVKPQDYGCPAAASAPAQFDLTVADETMTGSVELPSGVEGMHLTHVTEGGT